MNTLSHILRTDLRQFRMLIAVFVVLALAETALEIALPILAGDTRLGLSLATASSLVWITIVLFNVLLVGVIVQAHALVGSDAFWMTRPFPPRTLLLSKVAVIALLLIGLPVLCNIGVMILYQVPPGRIATVAIQSILLRAVFLVFLMSAASLTRNLAGLALLCGGALLAFALTIVISAMVMRARMEDEVAMLAVNVSPLAVSGHDSTADVLVLLLLIAAGVLLLLVRTAPACGGCRSPRVPPPSRSRSASLRSGRGRSCRRAYQCRTGLGRIPCFSPPVPRRSISTATMSGSPTDADGVLAALGSPSKTPARGGRLKSVSPAARSRSAMERGSKAEPSPIRRRSR